MTDELREVEVLAGKLRIAKERGEASIAKGVSANYTNGYNAFVSLCWNNRKLILAALTQAPDEVDKIVAWLREAGEASCAGAIERGDHLVEQQF